MYVAKVRECELSIACMMKTRKEVVGRRAAAMSDRSSSSRDARARA